MAFKVNDLMITVVPQYVPGAMPPNVMPLDMNAAPCGGCSAFCSVVCSNTCFCTAGCSVCSACTVVTCGCSPFCSVVCSATTPDYTGVEADAKGATPDAIKMASYDGLSALKQQMAQYRGQMGSPVPSTPLLH